MRTVLVTGGAGFIGSHLVDQLLESGASVRVLDNLSTGSLANLQAAAERHARPGGALNGTRLEVVIGDVRDRQIVRKALLNVKHVFHFAALPASAASVTDANDVHSVNVEGTLNLLHGALTQGVWRVVLASCASVYGTPDRVPVPEDAPVRPGDLFAASKVAAETYCQAFHARYQLETVSLRYFSVYGPRQRPTADGNVVPILLEALRSGHAVRNQCDRDLDDFTYVGDAVSAALAAARAPRAGGRIINIGSGQMVAARDVWGILTDLLGTVMVGGGSADRGLPPRQMCAQTTLATELLGFVPRVSLVAGLARLVASVGATEDAEQRALARIGPDTGAS
jgi:UDP-glucose 4-epimerase